MGVRRLLRMNCTMNKSRHRASHAAEASGYEASKRTQCTTEATMECDEPVLVCRYIPPDNRRCYLTSLASLAVKGEGGVVLVSSFELCQWTFPKTPLTNQPHPSPSCINNHVNKINEKVITALLLFMLHHPTVPLSLLLSTPSFSSTLPSADCEGKAMVQRWHPPTS
jgi:hypothetical protein